MERRLARVVAALGVALALGGCGPGAVTEPGDDPVVRSEEPAADLPGRP